MPTTNNTCSIWYRVDDGADLSMADDKFRVQIYANGEIVWLPGFKFRTTCKVDLTHFPFDEQMCYINVTSWLYTTEYVEFNTNSGYVDLSHIELNGEWDLKRVHADKYTSETQMGTISIVYCAVELRRRSLFYVMHILLPVFAMSSVSMFVFALPAESGEKISLGISVLISYSVLGLLVADSMPSNSDAMPVLSTYDYPTHRMRSHRYWKNLKHIYICII